MELESVSESLTGNKLSLLLGKTESILFASKKRLPTFYNLNVICDGRQIIFTLPITVAVTRI